MKSLVAAALIFCLFIFLIIIGCIIFAVINGALAGKRNIKNRQRMYTLLEKHLEKDVAEIPEDEIRHMRSYVFNASGMQDFLDFFVSYRKERECNTGSDEYIRAVLKNHLFGKKYITRKKYQDSYTLYLMSQFGLTDSTSVDFIFKELNSKSIYDRYNALQALSNYGNVEYMIRGLSLVNSSEHYFNKKVVIDSMDNFTGEMTKLSIALQKKMRTCKDDMRCYIIEHLRNTEFQDENSGRLMIGLLEKGSKEIQIASIKYLGALGIEDAVPAITEHMNSEDSDIRAVSAKILGLYDFPICRQYLTRGLSDENWNVRYNCAFSLAYFPDNEAEINIVNSSGDKFAKEILAYALSEKSVQRKRAGEFW